MAVSLCISFSHDKIASCKLRSASLHYMTTDSD